VQRVAAKVRYLLGPIVVSCNRNAKDRPSRAARAIAVLDNVRLECEGGPCMRSIIGTWRLVSATAQDGSGQPLPPPYGANGMGRVTFNADGRMMAVVCDGRPVLPPGTPRDYSSYCGNYTFDGARLVTKVDAASDPARIGTDQVREVRFDGARMVLHPPPRQSGGGAEHRELTWERIAAE
jgi:hypothetical protein